MKKSGFKPKTYDEKIALKKAKVKKQLVRNPNKLKKKKEKTLTWYKKEADAVFSRWIRQSNSIAGMVKCYTCGHLAEVKKMQNGHCLPRQYLSMRYSEKNCRPQCYACNMLYGGQIVTFLNKLCKEYGEEFRNELEAEKWKINKWEISDYKAIIEKYSVVILP